MVASRTSSSHELRAIADPLRGGMLDLVLQRAKQALDVVTADDLANWLLFWNGRGMHV